MAEISNGKLEDFYHVRKNLEPLPAKLPARKITPDKLYESVYHLSRNDLFQEEDEASESLEYSIEKAD